MTQHRGLNAPFSRLAEALAREPLTDDERRRLRDMPGFERQIPRILAAARSGRAIGADAFLSLHHLRGLDPLTSRAADPLMPARRGPLVWGHLAVALRYVEEHGGCAPRTARACARHAKVNVMAWHRARHGQPMSMGNLLALCAALDRHPHDFTAPAEPVPLVPRETRTVTTGAAA